VSCLHRDYPTDYDGPLGLPDSAVAYSTKHDTAKTWPLTVCLAKPCPAGALC
jgi:hypothetical protein